MVGISAHLLGGIVRGNQQPSSISPASESPFKDVLACFLWCDDDVWCYGVRAVCSNAEVRLGVSLALRDSKLTEKTREIVEGS